LLCECGFESLEEKVQTQIQIVASKIKDEENEGKKVQLSEKVKRMEYWHQKFVSLVPLYRKHSESVSKLKDSEFQDDEVKEGLKSLLQIWKQNAKTKAFFITSQG